MEASSAYQRLSHIRRHCATRHGEESHIRLLKHSGQMLSSGQSVLRRSSPQTLPTALLSSTLELQLGDVGTGVHTVPNRTMFQVPTLEPSGSPESVSTWPHDEQSKCLKQPKPAN